jgi:DNA-binding transcriptional ArsR family regulator
MAASPHPPGRAAEVRDPQVLRALAHPLRSRLLGLLRLDGPSTASRLAERVGESSGVTSYHLRRLEQFGFVAELEGRGTARERWWQAQHVVTSWEPDALVDQPGGAEANAAMQRLQIETWGRELRAWAAHGHVHGRQWAAVAGLSDYVLRLTPPQARELLDELYAVLDRWSEREREPDPDAVPVNVLAGAFPRSEP